MNVTSVNTMNYEKKTMNDANKNKPNTNPIKANTKPIKPKTNPIRTQNKPKQSLFQTGHLLIDRTKSKLLNFHPRKSLTAWLNSVKYHFLCSEREFVYEKLYGKERAGRA